MTSWYSSQELMVVFGGRVHPSALVSRNAKFYGDNVYIGEKSRVDDFCLLSGRVTIGPYVHLAAHVSVYGGKTGVTFGAHSCASPYSLVMTESDAFDGSALTGPTHPEYALKIKRVPVTIGAFAALCARATVLPGGGLAEGAVAGAHSLVLDELPAWGIYVGTPAKRIKSRPRDTMLTLADLVRMGHRDGEQH